MEKPDTQIKVKERFQPDNTFYLEDEEEQGGEAISRYTIFTLGIAAFTAGAWGLACLSKAMIAEGPLAVLEQLATALWGK